MESLHLNTNGGDKEPQKDKLDLTRETSDEVLNKINTLGNFDEYTNITDMYRMLPSEELVVRRENPEHLLESLQSNQPIEIKYVGDVPYANSVAWNPKIDGSRGIDNAFLEGHGHLNNVVMIYGFSKPEDFYFKAHAESSQVVGGIERSRVRTASGFVPTEAIRFITIRVPIDGFPQGQMTEDELDTYWEYVESGKKKPLFIYRGFLAKEEAAHQIKMAA